MGMVCSSYDAILASLVFKSLANFFLKKCFATLNKFVNV